MLRILSTGENSDQKASLDHNIFNEMTIGRARYFPGKAVDLVRKDGSQDPSNHKYTNTMIDHQHQ